MRQKLLGRIRALEQATPNTTPLEILIVFVSPDGTESPAYTLENGRLVPCDPCGSEREIATDI